MNPTSIDELRTIVADLGPLPSFKGPALRTDDMTPELRTTIADIEGFKRYLADVGQQ